MQYLNHMYGIAKSHYQQMPANTSEAMLIAGGVGFIIETITSSNPTRGLVAGLLSALTTAIHSFVTPFFRKFTQNQNQNQNQSLSWGGEMCRTFTAIIGTGCIAAAFGNDSILKKLYPLAVIYGVVTALNPSRGDLNSADWIPLFPNYAITP